MWLLVMLHQLYVICELLLRIRSHTRGSRPRHSEPTLVSLGCLLLAFGLLLSPYCWVGLLFILKGMQMLLLWQFLLLLIEAIVIILIEGGFIHCRSLKGFIAIKKITITIILIKHECAVRKLREGFIFKFTMTIRITLLVWFKLIHSRLLKLVRHQLALSNLLGLLNRLEQVKLIHFLCIALVLGKRTILITTIINI